METYPVDIEPEQIVAWLFDEERLQAHDLLVSATRCYQAGELGGGKSPWLSEEDREELSEVLEIGLLEVTPRDRPHRWALRVRVEDDIGPRLPEDEPLPEGEEDIDPQTFAEEFIKPGRGLAEVTVEVADDGAKASFDRLLSIILHDRHGVGGASRPVSSRAATGTRTGASKTP
jgi:hypothetical protein